MSTKNIFAGFGVRSEFVNLIYTELMKRKFVSYADILAIYCGRPKGYYDRIACNSEPGYGELKKAFPEVLKALTKIIPDSIEDNGQSKGKAYRYIGEIDDPLGEERKAVVQKSLEDYVLFCKASAGIMPASWFSSFFENTQLLLDTNREAKDGDMHISSSMEQNLTNIHLLPVFFKAITDKKVLRFDYHPFGQDTFSLTFHPQYLKEYNGRWFVFGDADREPYKAYNVPLDRIVGKLTEVNDVEYIPAPKGFYQDFFKNIIGVTHEKGVKVEQVVIHTKTKYQHGLLLTKPLHHSQKETLPFSEHEDGCYGEVALTIEPNRELRGKILAYGQYLEVIQPISLREQIIDIFEKQIKQYSHE
ncbi:MAG: WYL domain-containing protein [Prevotella sp.]|nr:WYL domain-containing protein [Prevotella sp.]